MSLGTPPGPKVAKVEPRTPRVNDRQTFLGRLGRQGEPSREPRVSPGGPKGTLWTPKGAKRAPKGPLGTTFGRNVDLAFSFVLWYKIVLFVPWRRPGRGRGGPKATAGGPKGPKGPRRGSKGQPERAFRGPEGTQWHPG